MANGKRTLTGSISSGQTLAGSVKGGSGTTDHSRLINRDQAEQHPIEAITNLRDELDNKLDSTTALPLINEALRGKAKGLYFDALKELARKPYWYLTAEIDAETGLGTKNSIISGPYDLGRGGGSGGGSGGGVTTVAVTQLDWPTVASVGNADAPTKIKVTWSSVIGEDRKPTGAGTMYLIINGRQIETRAKQSQGEVEFDITNYLVSGDNNVQVKVLDMYGTTGITVGIIEGKSLKLTSNFDSSVAFYNKIDYTYTPIGDVTKKVFFEVDGNLYGNQEVKSSNELITYTISGLSHGAHTLKVYFEAEVGGQTIQSNELFYDITYVQAGNYTPIIASDFNAFKQEQYISFKIPYRVFIDEKNMAQVTLKANGEVVRTSEVTTNGVHIWTYRVDDYTYYIDEKTSQEVKVSDPVVLEIICGEVSKRFEIAIRKSAITITPVLENLELALSAQGRSNDDFAEQRETWTYTNTTDLEPVTYTSIFKDFNWSSDGWVLDEQDINVLRIGGAARVEIPFKIFEKDCTARGKTIELEIATRAIRNYDTTIISCLDQEKTPFYTVEELFEQEETRLNGYKASYTYSILASTLKTEGTHLFTFKNKQWTLNDSDTGVNLADYGIKVEPVLLNAEGEDLGKDPLEGDRIRVTYSKEARGIKVTPQVASIRSQQSLLSTQYKEDEHIRIAFVVEPNTADKNRIIWMYINGVASGAMQYPADDTFKQTIADSIMIGSSEAVVDIYNIRVYNSALTNKQIVNNWIADTGNAADKAYRFNHNSVLTEQDQLTPESLLIGAPDLPYIIWGIDPLPKAKNDVRPGTARYVDPMDSTRNFTAIDAEYKVQGTSSAVYPTKNIRLRTKKGKGGPNLEWYDDDGNDLLIGNGGKGFPITTPNGIGVDYFTFKVDYASSEGANNVELTKLYNDASKTYGILTPPQKKDSRIRVGIDGFPVAAFQKDQNENVIFCTKANFNNDKGNPEVYGFEDGDESWETTNNSAAETKYQKPVTVDNFAKGFEIRFPDEDGYNKMDKLGPMTAWVYSTYRDEADENRKLEPAVTLTYTKAVPAEDGSFSTTEETKTFEYDTKEYRLTKFKAELKDWFNVDSCLFYYLFTELFLMIDSRAKNAFPTYYKSRQAGDGGDRWFWIPYDMDTAIGIDNKGKLTFDYFLEDTDQLYGADVYNGQNSVMWCNVRDAFSTELAAMYLKLRNQGLISYENVEKLFSEHQHKWPEVLLNLDAHNKYIVPLTKGDNYLEMLQGTKEQQRKWWLYNRFKYIDSKYNAGEAKSDFIQFRAYVDVNEEKPDLVITPYANIYATASFGNGAEYTVSKRVLNRGEAITLENPFGLADDENDQETYIYSASQLKSIGDISPFHPDTVKIGNAIRLQDLKVGDNGDKYPGYTNPYLKELTVGANTLLRTIDARNCVNLGTGTTVAPDLSQCNNIEEIYFTGTKIKGITLPDGGTIKTLHLPGTLTSLTIRNQPLLDNLLIENTNTTITKSAEQATGYIFRGLVVKKEAWNTTSANANLYLADAVDSSVQIRVSIADKTLYDAVVEAESVLGIKCDYIDARFDLVGDDTIVLAEHATRFITQCNIDNTLVPNISQLIADITAAITPPALEEFKTSLIERLWLEGIPSKAIKAKEFIKNMKEGTEVRLININETYEDTYVDGKLVPAWEQVKEFYDLLDRHYGINFNDSPVRPKAQVTGVINIDKISYKNYIELTRRYPEVTINAQQIISTVNFYNDNVLYKTITVPLRTVLDLTSETEKLTIVGKKIFAPLNPTKASTQAHYYTFEHWNVHKMIYSELNTWLPELATEIWTEDYLVVADTRIDAYYSEHLQDYSVSFDTDSDLITVDDDHANLVVKYGSTITKPQPINVPEAVELDGWYTPQGTRWFFEDEEGVTPTQVLDHVVLKAIWRDENKPSVTLIRQSYNTFRYHATDNLGIIKWAVVKDSDTEPTIWTPKQSTTTFDGSYVIDSAGEYYFWIADANGNKASQKIIAYPITVTTTAGITAEHFFFVEAGTEAPIKTDFALADTDFTITVNPDEHYENLKIDINTALGDDLDNLFRAYQPVEIALSCTPKDYTISFNLNGRGDPEKAADQVITYLHKVQRPFAQYSKPTGEIIDSWYKDTALTQRWDFDTDVVEQHMTLYAKWEAYCQPSSLTIHIPDSATSAAERTIILSYSQYNIDSDHKVIIDWGDGSDLHYSMEMGKVLHPQHEYAQPGSYQIKIQGTGGGTAATYKLGDGLEYQLIMPTRYLVAVDFAWDVSELAPYALYQTNISQTGLTSYMTLINTGCYASCENLSEINIPESVVEISDQAFYNCTNATGTVKIPKSIMRIGHNAFENCLNITNFEFLCDTTPFIFDAICRGCRSLKTIKLSDHIEITSGMFSGTAIEELELSNKIGPQAFAYCPNLRKVTSASNLIEGGAFLECSNLQEVYLTNSEAELATQAFASCWNLKHLESNSKRFGHQAFAGCTSLEKVILTNPELTMDTYVFNNCPGLQTVGPLTDKVEYDFNYAWTTEIPENAFMRDALSRMDIESITLPVELKKLGNYACYNAAGIYEILLPAGIEVLGEHAFEGCINLTRVTIPENVEYMGANLFKSCTGLREVNIKAPTSTYKVQVPENSWFLESTPKVQILIPSLINTSVENVQACYGTHWNAYMEINGNWEYLGYNGYTEPTI